MSCQKADRLLNFNGGGAYFSIGGSSVSLTWSAAGLKFAVGGQVSIVAVASGATTITWDPKKIL
jgi:hypothetical protein